MSVKNLALCLQISRAHVSFESAITWL